MTEVKAYRKRPVDIEAIRYDGTNAIEIVAWQYRYVQSVGHPSCWFFERSDFHGIPGLGYEQCEADAVVYDYLHRTWVGVWIGQWIIKGTEGEFYPVAEGVFAATYEEVSEPDLSDLSAPVVFLLERTLESELPSVRALHEIVAQWADAYRRKDDRGHPLHLHDPATSMLLKATWPWLKEALATFSYHPDFDEEWLLTDC